MIARSRLVGNFLSHSRVHHQVTKVVGFSQSVPLQSTNDNSEKNITLKLPPNATEVSVEHSNEISPDGTSLRAIFNVSVLQSNKNATESEQSCQQFKIVETKYQSHPELKVNVKQQNEILINGISKKVSEDNLRAYFSQFGEIETCAFVDWGYVIFKSPDAVKQVFNSAPHYLIGDRITNQNAELFAGIKKLIRTKCQRFQELKVSKNSSNNKMISIDGLSQEISQYAIVTYFSQFGRVDLCENKNWPKGWIKFKSPNAVRQVLNSVPHYMIGDRITNENDELFALVKGKLKVTMPRLVKEFFCKTYSASKLTFVKINMLPFTLAFYGAVFLGSFYFIFWSSTNKNIDDLLFSSCCVH